MQFPTRGTTGLHRRCRSTCSGKLRKASARYSMRRMCAWELNARATISSPPRSTFIPIMCRRKLPPGTALNAKATAAPCSSSISRPLSMPCRKNSLPRSSGSGCPTTRSGAKAATYPCALVRNGQRTFHYVPWLKLTAPDADARLALERLEAGIRQAKSTDLIELDLLPGEMVFVDNHRVMHGRAAIPANSTRHLKRFWIRAQRGGE